MHNLFNIKDIIGKNHFWGYYYNISWLHSIHLATISLFFFFLLEVSILKDVLERCFWRILRLCVIKIYRGEFQDMYVVKMRASKQSTAMKMSWDVSFTNFDIYVGVWWIFISRCKPKYSFLIKTLAIKIHEIYIQPHLLKPW